MVKKDTFDTNSLLKNWRILLVLVVACLLVFYGVFLISHKIDSDANRQQNIKAKQEILSNLSIEARQQLEVLYSGYISRTKFNSGENLVDGSNKTSICSQLSETVSSMEKFNRETIMFYNQSAILLQEPPSCLTAISSAQTNFNAELEQKKATAAMVEKNCNDPVVLQILDIRRNDALDYEARASKSSHEMQSNCPKIATLLEMYDGEISETLKWD